MTTKVCRGPTHDEPVALPATAEHWYLYKSGRDAGKPMHPCRRCRRTRARAEPNAGWMELTPVVRDAVVELVGRLGFSEASRRSGVSRTTMKELRRGRRTRFSRRTVARVLAAVREARATGEMRHKASVRHGASVRRPMIHRGGRPASKVTLEQAAEIRRRVESGASLRSVAGDFGICRQYVSRIARGEARTGEPFIRLPGKERKVRRISEQAGPVYPELEARSRAAESGARSRQREEIRREQEQREQRLLDLPGY